MQLILTYSRDVSFHFFICIDNKRPLAKSKSLLNNKICYHVHADKRRCFPSDHVMEKTQCSRQGARLLMKKIYGSTDHYLPTGLRTSVDIFVKFLKMHKSCPFKKILNNSCPVEGGAIKNVPKHQVV